jgi:hypothetical protein
MDDDKRILVFGEPTCSNTSFSLIFYLSSLKFGQKFRGNHINPCYMIKSMLEWQFDHVRFLDLYRVEI